MRSTLQRVTIKGLHGRKTIDLSIRDNKLVLVGKNGSGKTTFLRILFHVLSGRWLSLLQYRFDTIEIVISDNRYEIPHEAISKGFGKVDRRFLSELPQALRRRVMDLLQSGQTDRISSELEHFSLRYHLPMDLIMRQLSLFEHQSQGLNKEFQQQIIEIQKSILLG
jgi:predicted ATP-binding protein involved in virulence